MTLDLVKLLTELRSKNIEPDDGVYAALWSVDLQKLKRLRAHLERVSNFKATTKTLRGKKSRLAGEIFEKVIRLLFKDCAALTCGPNVKTSISEIDFLVTFGPTASCIPLFATNGTHFVGEAKFHDGGIKTEWINELRGINQAHGATLAVLFTRRPGLVQRQPRIAVALQAAQGHLIVPFGPTQLNKIEGGANFLAILSEQAVAAKTHNTQLSV